MMWYLWIQINEINILVCELHTNYYKSKDIVMALRRNVKFQKYGHFFMNNKDLVI